MPSGSALRLRDAALPRALERAPEPVLVHFDPWVEGATRAARHSSDHRLPPRSRRLAIALIVLAHLLLGVIVHRAMQVDPRLDPRAAPAPAAERVLEIRFVDEAAPLDPATAIPPPARRGVVTPVQAPARPSTPSHTRAQPAPAAREEPTSSEGMSVRFIGPEAPTEPKIDVFNPDGSLRLPADAGDPEAPLFRDRAAARAAQETKPQRALPYERTRFDRAWAPDGETAVGEFFRRSAKTKTFKTPWGTKIKCGWMLTIGGCSFGIPPTPLANAPRAPEPSNPVPAATPAAAPVIAPYVPGRPERPPQRADEAPRN